MDMTSSVLSFLAENVNLYNWYLLRGPNPNRYMYDETEEAMSKLYYKLFEKAFNFAGKCRTIANKSIMPLNIFFITLINTFAYDLFEYINEMKRVLSIDPNYEEDDNED